MSILNQNLLTLDFWQDKVTYGKQTVPIGTIGCAALNITDEQITELITLCQPLTEVILMLGTGKVDVSVFPMAEKSLLTIIRFLQKTKPFSFLDLATDEKELHRFFDEEHIENIVAYIYFHNHSLKVQVFWLILHWLLLHSAQESSLSFLN